jgi:hypothetical protein
MNDTAPEIEEVLRRRLMALSPEERLRMAAASFDVARRIVLASFPPGLTPLEVRRRLYERLYGGPNPYERPEAAASPSANAPLPESWYPSAVPPPAPDSGSAASGTER